MPADPQRVRALFFDLVEHVPAAEWPGRLAAACGDDAELRQRVQALLDAHASPDPLFDLPDASPAPLDISGPLHEGMVLGPYTLLHRLDGGGMGEVWVAQRQQPVQLLVALKIIKPGMITRNLVARFKAEQEALALMDHPNIARVYDAGTTPSGHPWFVMELVKGVPITQYCDEHRLTVRQRLELFLPVCQAVQHAHQKGIIHRDVKPSNILVAEYDGAPVPKVIDFGIAKSVAGPLTEGTIWSEIGCILGTVQYMSPEQAKLNQLDVDTRSDVYSLGVLLYELLTGSPPLERERLKAAALDEVLQVIREEEPPRPSTRLSTLPALPAVAACRHAAPADLARLVRGELDWIVLRALDKDREHRYQTPTALAEDIQAHLADAPVRACPPSAAYRLRKYVRRHRAAVAAAAAVLAALVLGVVGTTAGMVQARQARGRAESEAAHRRYLGYLSDMRLAGEAREAGDLDRVRRLLARHVPRAGEADLRGFEWFHLWRLWRQTDASTIALADPASNIHHFSLSPDGTRLAILRARGPYRVTLVDMVRREELESFGTADRWGWVGARPLLSADGTTAVFVGPLWYPPEVNPHIYSRKLTVRDLPTGHERTIELNNDNGLADLAPDNRTLALAGGDNAIHLWDLAEWKDTGTLADHEGSLRVLRFAPSGRHLAAAGIDRTVRVWDVAGRRLAWKRDGHADLVWALAWSPDGRLLATGSKDQTVAVWDAATGERRHVLAVGRGEILALAFSPDSRLLAVASHDGIVRVYRLPDLAEHDVIAGCGKARSLAFLPTGELIFARTDGRIAIKPVPPADRAALVAPKGFGHLALVTSPAGDTFLAAPGFRDGHKVFVWDVTRDEATERPPIPLDFVPHTLAVSRQGTLAVVSRASARVRLYRFPTGEPDGHFELPGDRTAESVRISPAGRFLALGCSNGTVGVWDLHGRRLLGEWPAHEARVVALAFVGDDMLLTGGYDGTACLWDAATGRRLNAFPRVANPVSSAAASPDGRMLGLGYADVDPHLALWGRNGPSWREAGELRGHLLGTTGLAMLSDGRTAVSSGEDRTVRVWDIARGEERCVLRGGTSPLEHLAVSDDERLLAAGAWDGTIRLWRAASPEEVQAVPGWWRRGPENEAP